MDHALAAFAVNGVETTIPFLRFLIGQPDFREGLTHVRWIETILAGGSAAGAPSRAEEVGNERR